MLFLSIVAKLVVYFVCVYFNDFHQFHPNKKNKTKSQKEQVFKAEAIRGILMNFGMSSVRFRIPICLLTSTVEFINFILF